MRQLNRLNQFQRLWYASQGERQLTSVTEMAGRCFCSERHMRTLLGQWQHQGWLSWQAQSGRGRRGELRFLKTPDLIRRELLQQQLALGQPHHVLELINLEPAQLSQLLKPFMGGQWQDDRPTLRIPYYRPLDRLHLPDVPGRAEQHLARQIYAGLTRFVDNKVAPDLAHHWQCSADGLSWFFFLRPQLYWHNGERVASLQLLHRLQQIRDSETGRKLLAAVKSLTLPQALCLRIDLHAPDSWLPYRLATVPCLLAHPDEEKLGTGPWRIAVWSRELIRIENHERYHDSHPLMQAVEYWITPQLFDRALGNSCRHPVQIAIGQPDELAQLRPVSRRLSLGFCYMAINQKAALTPQQRHKLMGLVQSQGMIDSLPLQEGLIAPSHEILPGWKVPDYGDNEAVTLPATLHLYYHLPVELHAMAEKLKSVLAEEGCELSLHFHAGKTWQACEGLEKADLIMGDRLIGEAPEFTLETWLRLDRLWPAILGEVAWTDLITALGSLQRSSSERNRHGALQQVFHRLMSQAVITPLFNYRYQISAPPGVEGIALNARGWFDFSRAWIPPPVAIV
ncbi:SgrR family transcriptional regulator [Pantoea sp. FN060301]|uniref:SgrR family transcriptional regulator n=1 Tax=Pantoea sp. FN060301 TaxID=3420380 RepID=UPI003D17A914